MSFSACRRVEAEALAVLVPFLEEKADGRLVVTSKGRLAPFLQETVGDVIYSGRNDGRMWTVEIKAERENRHGNIFLETWSNRNLDDADSHALRGSNVGWLAKLRADLLFYYFITSDSLYVFNLFGLKRWAYGYERVPGNLYRPEFKEKLQSKYQQANDTWGRCVPIRTLMDEVEPEPRLIHPLQLALPLEAQATGGMIL